MPSFLPLGAVSSTVSPSEHSRSVASVIGIDQISPEERRMFSQTDFQSSEPMKPVERREAAVADELEVGGLSVR